MILNEKPPGKKIMKLLHDGFSDSLLVLLPLF